MLERLNRETVNKGTGWKGEEEKKNTCKIQSNARIEGRKKKRARTEERKEGRRAREKIMRDGERETDKTKKSGIKKKTCKEIKNGNDVWREKAE